MRTFHTFPNEQAARDYRHTHGAGGWIFSPDNAAPERLDHTPPPVVLFPPDMPPAAIFRHPFTRGQSGHLIGCN